MFKAGPFLNPNLPFVSANKYEEYAIQRVSDGFSSRSIRNSKIIKLQKNLTFLDYFPYSFIRPIQTLQFHDRSQNFVHFFSLLLNLLDDILRIILIQLFSEIEGI